MGHVCGGECDMMDRVIEEWRRALVPYVLPDAVRAVPDADRKGFNLQNYEVVLRWVMTQPLLAEADHNLYSP